MAAKRRTKGAGSVRTLPSGKYQARFVGPDGQRHNAPHTFQTKGDAQAWLRDQADAVRNDAWEPPSKQASGGGGMSLNAYFDRWLPRQDHLRQSTAELYKSQWDRLVRDSLGARPIANVTKTHVADWRDELDPGKPTQRRQVYALVRQVFAAAMREEVIAENPAPPRAAAQPAKHETEVLTPSEIVALAKKMPERYRALVLVSAWCGLRFGEAAALQRRDIDIEGRRISVRRGAMRTKDGTVVGSTKTRSSVRTVVIPSHIVGDIKQHLDDYVAADMSALVFAGANGRVLAPSSLYKVFYPARKKIGHPGLHWHDLRHTAGTLAAQAGGTLREIQDRLGHSTVGAAMRYQHAAAVRQQELADRLAALAQTPEK